MIKRAAKEHGLRFIYTLDWRVYYALVYATVIAGLGMAAIIGMTHYLMHVRKRTF